MCQNIKENELNFEELTTPEAIKNAIDQELAGLEKDYENLKKFKKFAESLDSVLHKHPELKEESQRLKELIEHEIEVYKRYLLAVSTQTILFTHEQKEKFHNLSARPIPELKE